MNKLISIVIPTKNEEKNIVKLLDWGIKQSSQMHEPKFDYEAIVVDDSDDNQTAFLAINNGARVIQGQGKGLGQAILDGIQESKGDIVVVMDADLSHNPHAIPGLIKPILEQGYDMVVGSRYIDGGGISGWERSRRIISKVACMLALPVTSIKDATSGFFAFRKSIISGVKLEASSWKIMLEVLLKARPIRVIELPMQFEVRREGKSKFNKKQMLAYLKHLLLLFGWRLHEFFKISITITNDPKSPDYEWISFYKGKMVQKWWKRRNAKIVWNWMPNMSTLLDVGCGSSPIINHYPNAVGVDINVKKLNFMKERCPNITFKRMSADKIEYKDGKFDHVLCLEVLEHLENPEQTVKEISRVLRKGGNVILATPDYSKWIWRFMERFTPTKEEHVYQFTREKLEAMCKKHNLYPIRHKYTAWCDLFEEFVKAG